MPPARKREPITAPQFKPRPMLRDDAEWVLIQLGVTDNFGTKDNHDFEMRLLARSGGGYNISVPAEWVDDVLRGRRHPHALSRLAAIIKSDEPIPDPWKGGTA